MKVNEAMSRDVKLTTPTQSIREAAKTMGEIDSGVLPVAEDDKLVGMITDRDITIRAVAEGKSPDTRVGEVMTHEVLYCFDDEEVEEVSRTMADKKVRRMPVVNRDKRLVGIVTMADLAQNEEPDTVGRTISEISKPGGEHSQRIH